MDIYQSAVSYLLTLPTVRSWPELEALLTRSASGRPRDWQLPVIACQAVGGSAAQAIPAAAAIACAQMSIILIDDMLDEDPRGEYLRIGAGNAANFSASFQAIGLEALRPRAKKHEIEIPAWHCLNRMMMTIAYGQHLDIQSLPDETAYWRVVEHKSAPFFGAALHLGALYGGASSELAQRMDEIGRLYGEMIQIHDDLNDTMAVPASPDWKQRRLPLPILFAHLVDYPARTRFLELYQDISLPETLREAQDIIIGCGAVSYCMSHVLSKHQAAQSILAGSALSHPDPVKSLLDGAVAPVWKLLKSVENRPIGLASAEE
jgi:geranylgeranyl diphosphate synthase, type I